MVRTSRPGRILPNAAEGPRSENRTTRDEQWRPKALHSRPANCRLNWALSGLPAKRMPLMPGSLPLLRQVSVALHKDSVAAALLGVAVLLRDVVPPVGAPQPVQTLPRTLVLIRTTTPRWRLSGTDNSSRKMVGS